MELPLMGTCPKVTHPLMFLSCRGLSQFGKHSLTHASVLVWQKCSGFFVLLVMVMVKPVQLSVERPLSVSAVRRFVELLMLPKG